MSNYIEEIKSFWPHPWPFEQIVEQLPDAGALIEIGPYLGKSTITWADEFEKAGKDWHIHTIDAFEGISGKFWATDHPAIDFLETLKITEEEHLTKFRDNINGWNNITWEKLRWTPDYKCNPGAYDVLFYDGLHDYEHCKEALEFFAHRVTWMVIDDYDPMHEGTMKAVDEVFASLPYEKEFEHIITEDKGIAVMSRRY